MTLKQIRDSVLAKIGVDHELTNAQIDQFINEGYKIVAARIMDATEDYFGATEDISMVTGTTEYEPTNEFLSVRGVECDFNEGVGYKRATAVEYRDIKNTDKVSTTYFSKICPLYYFWGKKIGVVPTPDNNGTLRIRGIVTPTDLSSDSDTPQFISTHHYLLGVWAQACAVEAVDQNYLDGDRKRIQFYNGLDDLTNVVKDRQADSTKKIKIANLY